MFQVGGKYTFKMISDDGDGITEFYGEVERYDHPLLKLKDSDPMVIRRVMFGSEGAAHEHPIASIPGQIINVTSVHFVSAVQHPAEDASARTAAIDLNDPANITYEAVRDLIASKDDSQHRQLRITDAGVAFLSDNYGLSNLDGIAARYETWDAGNGYCGTTAAADPEWVEKVAGWLRTDWAAGKRGYLDL